MNRTDLNLIPVPSQTKTYQPVSTRLIFDTIDTLSAENNMFIIQEHFEVKKRGDQQKLRFNFDTGDPRFSFELAAINSYDKTISLRVGAGSTANICWNLMIMAPFKIQERHVGNVREDLYEFLKDSFTISSQQVINARLLWDKFDFINLSKKEIAELAGELFFIEKLINSEQASILRKEIEKPSFKYECNDQSLNYLYQGVTHAIKNEHPMSYLQTQQAVQSFFVNKYQEISSEELIFN